LAFWCNKKYQHGDVVKGRGYVCKKKLKEVNTRSGDSSDRAHTMVTEFLSDEVCEMKWSFQEVVPTLSVLVTKEWRHTVPTDTATSYSEVHTSNPGQWQMKIYNCLCRKRVLI
jgi:hypothetical protein